jgi:alanine racemase
MKPRHHAVSRPARKKASAAVSDRHRKPALPLAPFLEISLDNLLFNLSQIRTCLPPAAQVMAVVKDNAYGCGAGPIAKTLEKNGVSFFAVSTANEAHFLREQNLHSPVLIFGKISDHELRWASQNNIHCTLDDLRTLSEWAETGLPITFHCEIDTGMGRMGIQPSDMPHCIDLINKNPKLNCVGACTHFACADNPETDTVDRQMRLFNDCLKALKSSDIQPTFIHCANSAAVLRFPGKFNMVRPGIALYGCKPDPAQDFGVALKPVASLKSRVIKLKRVPAGTPISYGWRYTCPSDTYIATIQAGYGQGVPRFLSNKGSVLIAGRRYQIAGTVTMDFIMVDVGAKPAFAVGEEAVIMGTQGNQSITPDEIALQGKTISYEILCNLGTSIPRYFYLDKRLVSSQAPFLF